MTSLKATNVVQKLFLTRFVTDQVNLKVGYGAVVVAELVERSLPLPEVRGSNPVIGKNLFIYIEHLFTVNCVLER